MICYNIRVHIKMLKGKIFCNWENDDDFEYFCKPLHYINTLTAKRKKTLCSPKCIYEKLLFESNIACESNAECFNVFTVMLLQCMCFKWLFRSLNGRYTLHLQMVRTWKGILLHTLHSNCPARTSRMVSLVNILCVSTSQQCDLTVVSLFSNSC